MTLVVVAIVRSRPCDQTWYADNVMTERQNGRSVIGTLCRITDRAFSFAVLCN
jgi:hypothetical protein